MKLNENEKIICSNCILVPYNIDHVPKYHNWMEDEEIRRLTGSERLSLDEEYAMQKSWREDEDKLTFIILKIDPGSSEENSMVGDVNLFIDNEDKSAEVEIMLAEAAARGKKIGSTAVKAIISYAINKLNINKYFAKITDDNEPSLAMFRKLGFTVSSHSAVFGEYTLELETPDNLRCFIGESSKLLPYR